MSFLKLCFLFPCYVIYIVNVERSLLSTIRWKDPIDTVGEKRGHPQHAKVGEKRSHPHLCLLVSLTLYYRVKMVLSNSCLHPQSWGEILELSIITLDVVHTLQCLNALLVEKRAQKLGLGMVIGRVFSGTRSVPLLIGRGSILINGFDNFFLKPGTGSGIIPPHPNYI